MCRQLSNKLFFRQWGEGWGIDAGLIIPDNFMTLKGNNTVESLPLFIFCGERSRWRDVCSSGGDRVSETRGFPFCRRQDDIKAGWHLGERRSVYMHHPLFGPSPFSLIIKRWLCLVFKVRSTYWTSSGLWKPTSPCFYFFFFYATVHTPLLHHPQGEKNY